MMTIAPLSTPVIAHAPAVSRAVRAAAAAPAPANSTSLLGELSDEEREFFRQPVAATPMSYGRGGVAARRAEAPLGQLLDLRA